MYYLYTLRADRVLIAARRKDGSHISNVRRETVEQAAQSMSIEDGKVYTLDTNANLDKTIDGKLISLPNASMLPSNFKV